MIIFISTLSSYIEKDKYGAFLRPEKHIHVRKIKAALVQGPKMITGYDQGFRHCHYYEDHGPNQGFVSIHIIYL